MHRNFFKPYTKYYIPKFNESFRSLLASFIPFFRISIKMRDRDPKNNTQPKQKINKKIADRVYIYKRMS